MILNLFQKVDNAISYLFNNTVNEKKFLKSFFGKKKITYVDIGANVGSYSDLLINTLNIKKGFLIEPSPSLFTKLSNRFNSKFFINYNFAISNFNKKKKSFYEYKLSSQSSLYEQCGINSFNDLKEKFNVETKKFDDVMDRGTFIDLCKIDTQGEELNVLKGMSIFLKKKLIKLIKIEITFFASYKSTKTDYVEIINLMIKYNYKLVTISKIKFDKGRVLFLDAYFELSK
jgi:FkbM family methyltransferase